MNMFKQFHAEFFSKHMLLLGSDQVNILHPSVQFNLNILSAACKMLYSGWLKVRTQNQVNILPAKWIWGGGGGRNVNFFGFYSHTSKTDE